MDMIRLSFWEGGVENLCVNKKEWGKWICVRSPWQLVTKETDPSDTVERKLLDCACGGLIQTRKPIAFGIGVLIYFKFKVIPYLIEWIQDKT